MDFIVQFHRLTGLLSTEVKSAAPSVFRAVSYLFQLMFVICAIIVTEGWKLLLRLGDEIEKMQKNQKKEKEPVVKRKHRISERYDCAFVNDVSCTPSCTSWVKVRGGGGYCKRLRSEKR